MITTFILLAMTFFLYVGVKIGISKNVSLLEKLFASTALLILETYYVLQLLERW